MASHPSPFCRQRQSNKSLDPSGPTAKFLYTILKQLDLKNIDWNEVASNLDITNGHAARMRWSRFRAQIEGLDNSYSRKGYKKKEAKKKRKNDEGIDDGTSRVASQPDESVGSKRPKLERGSDIKTEFEGGMRAKGNSTNVYGCIKEEQEGGKTVIDGVTIHHPAVATIKVPETPSIRSSNHHQSNNVVSRNHSNTDVHSMQSVPIEGLRTAYGTQNGYSHNQWSQQPSMTYNYSPRSNLVSPGYYHSTTLPPNQYQYPASFVNQSQPRFNYAHPAPFGHIQQVQNFQHNNVSTVMPTNRNPATISSLYSAQMPPPVSHPQHPNTVNQGMASFKQSRAQTPALAASHTPSTSTQNIQPQSNAYQLASEASYPWPYSEALVSKFAPQPTATGKPEASVGLPDHAKCLSSGLEMTLDLTEGTVPSTTEFPHDFSNILPSQPHPKSNGRTNISGNGIMSATKDKANNTTTNSQMSTTLPVTPCTQRETVVKTEPGLLQTHLTIG